MAAAAAGSPAQAPPGRERRVSSSIKRVQIGGGREANVSPATEAVLVRKQSMAAAAAAGTPFAFAGNGNSNGSVRDDDARSEDLEVAKGGAGGPAGGHAYNASHHGAQKHHVHQQEQVHQQEEISAVAIAAAEARSRGGEPSPQGQQHSTYGKGSHYDPFQGHLAEQVLSQKHHVHPQEQVHHQEEAVAMGAVASGASAAEAELMRVLLSRVSVGLRCLGMDTLEAFEVGACPCCYTCPCPFSLVLDLTTHCIGHYCCFCQCFDCDGDGVLLRDELVFALGQLDLGFDENQVRPIAICRPVASSDSSLWTHVSLAHIWRVDCIQVGAVVQHLDPFNTGKVAFDKLVQEFPAM
jgi:hypothetical protein